MSRALVLALAVLSSSLAFGHARLKGPVPRSNSAALKDPNGPCGNVPRTGAPAVYTAGQMVPVTFEETINHRGCFLISLSQANDQNFVSLTTVQHSTVGGLPRQYSAMAQLPAGVTCQNCTVQLIQVMLDSYDGGACLRNLPGASNYYSCADVRIVAGDGGVPDAGSAGGGSGSAGGGSAGGGSAGGGSAGGGSAGGGSAGGGSSDPTGGGTAQPSTGGGSAAAGGGSQTSAGGGSEVGAGGGSMGAAGGGTMTSSSGGSGMVVTTGGGSSGGVVDGDVGVGCTSVAVAPLSVIALAGLALIRRRRVK